MSSVAWNATGSIYSADCRVKRPSPLRFVMNLNDLDGFEENTLPFPHTVKQVVWDMMQESSDEGEPTKMDLDDKEPIEIYLDDEEPTAIDSNREESDTKMPLAVISLVRYPSIQPDIEDIDSPASAHKMATSKLLHLAQKAIRMVNFRRSVPGWPTVFLLQKSFSLGRSNRDPKTAPVLQLHFDLHKVIKRMGDCGRKAGASGHSLQIQLALEHANEGTFNFWEYKVDPLAKINRGLLRHVEACVDPDMC